MKNNLLFPAFLLVGLGALAQADLRLVKVDPVKHEVTVKNFGNVAQNATGFNLCEFPDYQAMGFMPIVSGNINIAPGASITVVFAPIGGTHGECGLYTNASNFGNAANMRDYFQWGNAGHTRESVAVAGGYWTAGTFVSGTPAYDYIGTANDNGADFWTSQVSGCTYVTATNYNPAATLEDGTCTFNNSSCPSDLDSGGMVGFSDLSLFLNTYGQVCP